MTLKTIPLQSVHEALGAKMVPFAGYLMPVRYSSDLEEHLCVRQKVGIFDVSHMGEFLIKGPRALDLIQRVSANDASTLSPGKVQYSYLPNVQGGVVDDLLIYCLAPETYYLVVNASNIEKDWNWIASYNTEGVDMTNLSENTCLFAVQGPLAEATLQGLTDIPLGDMAYYTCQQGTLAGISNVLISATGYTGAGGFELYVPSSEAEAVWNAILSAGAPHGIQPIGLGARDTLRLEMGYCLYGNDITDETSPLEAGLGWVTKFTKSFVNSEALQEQKRLGLERKLVAILMVDKAIPRSHYPVCAADGTVIGEVTSGTMSPVLQKGIALAYVALPHAQVGQEVWVKVREKLMRAEVVKLPFVSKGV